MGDTTRDYRSDRKPTFAQSLCVGVMREDIKLWADALGESPLTLLNWARDQELRPVKQAARKTRGAGRKPADWACATGFDNPADLLVIIEILVRLGEPWSRRKLLTLAAKAAGDGKSQEEDRKRAAKLKDLYRAPPAVIRVEAEERISMLPADKSGLQSALDEISRRIWPADAQE